MKHVQLEAAESALETERANMFEMKDDNNRLTDELDDARDQLEDQRKTLMQAQEVISNIERKVRRLFILLRQS